MNYEQKLLVGRALKALMQSYGRQQVFQNIYKTGTRSIKCYRNRMDANEVLDLQDSIHRLMTAFGISMNDYQVNLTNGNRWGGAGFIVKF